MEIAVAPGGNVYIVELAGKVKYYNAATGSIRVVGTIPVHRGNENGLLGIALDPNFATNKWMYLFYSAPTPEAKARLFMRAARIAKRCAPTEVEGLLDELDARAVERAGAGMAPGHGRVARRVGWAR